jgi:hypothetical protein
MVQNDAYKISILQILFTKKNLVYTRRYMDTINQKQEQAPQLSIVEQKKMEAGKFVAERMETLISNDPSLSTLTAAHKVYEEVKGQLYREEQAVAKLLEYLTMQNEVSMRGEELIKSYDALSSVVAREKSVVSPQQQQSANDDKYLVANVA